MREGRTMSTTKMKTKMGMKRRLIAALAAGAALLGVAETASAQEILLTGPLAGAPAVRKLRLYREGRFEIAPAVTFTLLEEYQRHILLGGRIQYNVTDWLGIGAWGAYGGLLQIPTGLTDEIQTVNQRRRGTQPPESVDRRLTAVNLGPNFEDQIAGINWVAAPQLSFVPFRGKLALFQSIYLDTELYFFAGAAFVNVSERANCETDCSQSFERTERTAVAPTGGLGFSFFANQWNALGFEARVTPFAYNTGGFDTAGGGQDKEFPDNRINEDDRELRPNIWLTLSWNFDLPTEYRISE
jgi:outer membrane beta-barrel protein